MWQVKSHTYSHTHVTLHSTIVCVCVCVCVQSSLFTKMDRLVCQQLNLLQRIYRMFNDFHTPSGQGNLCNSQNICKTLSIVYIIM